MDCDATENNSNHVYILDIVWNTAHLKNVWPWIDLSMSLEDNYQMKAHILNYKSGRICKCLSYGPLKYAWLWFDLSM